MDCGYYDRCGGCSCRSHDENAYRREKTEKFRQILCGLPQKEIRYGDSVFIAENTRRRAAFTFDYKKGRLNLGFNAKASHEIVSVSRCPLLTPLINRNIPSVGRLLSELCQTPIIRKNKKGKSENSNLSSGDVLVCEAGNGLDIVIQTAEDLNVNHRMIIGEFLHDAPDVIRISRRRNMADDAETIAEKTRPVIDIAGVDVFIPAGTFLQASKAGEEALVNLVMKYAETSGDRIADLFCGIGTFSYPLSKNKNNRILAVDNSLALLEGFKKSVNKNMITNIEVMAKNLFKYPLDERELQNFDIVIFDPPRAGASAQAEKIAATEAEKRPKKIIAVSCNPHSFIKDANSLVAAGYTIEEITLVDQFVYSNHCELVALFTK